MKRCLYGHYLVGVLLALAVACPAMAGDVDDAQSDGPVVNEFRVGGFLHDLVSPESRDGPDLNAEILFAKPWGTSAQWWLPRPSLGTTLDFGGGTSTVYAGATWQYNVTDWMFVEGSFGGSLNNGRDNDVIHHSDLGCNALFRESATLGLNVSEHWRVMGTIEHNSNAGLCDSNRGLTNYGLRVGYKF